MSTGILPTFQLSSLQLLIDFCLQEIALEGLQGAIHFSLSHPWLILKFSSLGCQVNKLFGLFAKSSRSLTSISDGLSDNQKINRLFAYIKDSPSTKEADQAKEFVWRILLSRSELDFYLVEEEFRNAPHKISGLSDSRGYCNNLEQRVRVNQFIREGQQISKKLSDCLVE